MANASDFRISRAFFLREQGPFALNGRQIERKLGAAWCVLSRPLCRFELFTPPGALSLAQADRAARLFAEINVPYRISDFLILRGVAGYGVWWWDRERVTALTEACWLYDGEAVVPESALHEAGEGWRVVALADGFEGQCWRDLTLVASAWRRREFSNEQWRAFAQSDRAGEESGPDSPPTVQALSLDLSRAAGLARLKPPLGWKAWERAGWATVSAALLCAAVFLGGAARYEALIRAQPEASDLSASAQENPDMAALREMQARREQPDPVLVLARVVQTLSPFAVQPTDWEVADARLRVQFTNENGAPVERMAQALEADDWLSNVSAQIDSVSGVVSLYADICPALSRAACQRAAP